MARMRRFHYSVNPATPSYVALGSVFIALFLGLFRFVLLDRTDPVRCGALVTRGRWLGPGFSNWQPDGCMLHRYLPAEAERCLAERTVVFLGDSVTRSLFFGFAHTVDPRLPKTVPDESKKHADYVLHTSSSAGMRLVFYWDPFLNSSHVATITSPTFSPPADRPAVLVIGAGLWFLRYADASGGLPVWEGRMKLLVDALVHAPTTPADHVFILPVQDVVASKLSPERAATMLGSDRDAMNSDLFHRIHPLGSAPLLDDLTTPSRPVAPVTLPVVFNDMLDPSQTDDGLHFSDAIVRMQAHILLNAHCNDRLSDAYPFDKTCCSHYPRPKPLHLVVLAVLFCWGPCMAVMNHWHGRRGGVSHRPSGGGLERAALVISGALALVYLADRTPFWLKEQKHFDAWTVALISLGCLAIGLGTVTESEKDPGFLHREQTDEWKGWMQVAILVYHYFGASAVSGIYNPIRVLVASYLFMTGYGHTTFYLKKADFGLARIAQVVIRINLFTLFLAYTMDTDYINYYFSPLVTVWYFIIYGTMFVGAHYNDRSLFVLAKCAVSSALVTRFMSDPSFLEWTFRLLERVCAIHWSAKEWAFRMKLDLWIVYAGMLTALATIKAREFRWTDHPRWSLVVKIAVVLSCCALVWYLNFELAQPDKFAYNAWHPYIAFLPVLSYIILRNANAVMRSAYSRAFVFVGRCSLETFIIQYHLWLAADTHGILMVIPWTRWRFPNMFVTAAMFIFVSHHVSNATNEITSWICGQTDSQRGLPTSASEAAPPHLELTGRHDRDDVTSSERTKDDDRIKEDESPPIDPPTPHRPRWVDRLAGDAHAPARTLCHCFGDFTWIPGLKTRLLLGLGFMWILNMLW